MSDIYGQTVSDMDPRDRYAQYSAWGRWGPDDERGTANLLTPEAVLAACRLVKRGVVYKLAQSLEADSPISSDRNPLWHRTSVTQRRDQIQSGTADDVVLMHTHGTTHIDGLAHVFYGDQMWNGYAVDEALTATEGASRNGVQNIGALVGRGVLLDLARARGVDHLDAADHVDVAELDRCAQLQGVELRAGDIVLMRTGWINVFDEDPSLYRTGSPGPDVSAAEWFHRHDLCALGADTTAVEATPYSKAHLNLHRAVIRNMGGYLLELMNLEELARDSIYEFLFIAAPLRLKNGVGSPLTPLAIT